MKTTCRSYVIASSIRVVNLIPLLRKFVSPLIVLSLK